jgi:hypothetical protein
MPSLTIGLGRCTGHARCYGAMPTPNYTTMTIMRFIAITLSLLLLAAGPVNSEERNVPRLAFPLGVSAITSKQEILKRYPGTKCQPVTRAGYEVCDGLGLSLFGRVSSRTIFIFVEPYLHAVFLEWPSENEEPINLSRKIGAEIAEYLGVPYEKRQISLDQLEPHMEIEMLYWNNLLRQHVSLIHCPRKTKMMCAGKTVSLNVLMQPEEQVE